MRTDQHLEKCNRIFFYSSLNFIHEAVVFQLVLEEFVERVCTVVVLSIRGVVSFAVCQHSLHVRDKESLVDVILGFKSL